MADDRRRSLALMSQLTRLRDAQLEGQRLVLEAAQQEAARALQGLTRLDAEIDDLDQQTRRLAEDAQGFHAHAVMVHARYRTARAGLRAAAHEAYRASTAQLEQQRETARQLLAERDALSARHERLLERVERDAQRQGDRELDALVSARCAREKGAPC